MKIVNKRRNILVFLLSFVMLVGCSTNISVPKDTTGEGMSEEQVRKGYEVDYFKVSSMIKENVDQDVVDAALTVIEAFLNYEVRANVVVSGNEYRFLNDMGYVIQCTCPMFSAFTIYDEMTWYDSERQVVEWEFLVSQAEFKTITEEFSEKVDEYLSVVDKEDSDSMKAILLYYKLIQDTSYDYDILGDAYETMDKKQYHLRTSSYNVLVNKTGICTNLSQALMFLYTQVDLASGTVLHQGGAGSHMWAVVKIDEQYSYCDPTWDVGASLKTFGITSSDRSSWAGEYTKEGGMMLDTVVALKYSVDDERFVTLRQKVPVEITDIKVDKIKQTITFEGYEYEYTFHCGNVER